MTTKQSESEYTSVEKLNPEVDPFIDDCFSFDFFQQIENRLPSEIKGLKDVPGLVQKKEYSKAWKILDRHQDKFSDFDFIYVWQAVILQRNGQKNEARETLNDGLNLAKTKHVLCDRMGLLEYEAGQMEAAVKWWIRSIAVMMNSGNLKMWEPFLYLAYTAKACGSQNLFNRLMGHVSQISPQGELSLEPDAEKQILTRAADTLAKKSIISAIEQLYNTFGKDFKIPEVSQQKKGTPPKVNKNPKSDAYTPQNKPNKNRTSLLLGLVSILILALLAFFLFSSPTEDSLPVTQSQQEENRIGTNPAMQQEPESENALPSQQASTPQTTPEQNLTDNAPSNVTPLKNTESPSQKEQIQTARKPAPSSPETTPHKEKLRRLKVKTKTTHPDVKKKSD